MDLDRIIRDQDFELVRDKKHKVYRHADGRTFTVSKTPSDWRSAQNKLSTFEFELPITESEMKSA